MAKPPTPLPVLVKRYQCPFCRCRRASRTAATAHMERCWFNPANRTCKTCTHFAEAFTASADEWCFPGRRCSCNDSPASCEAGVDLPAWDGLPVTGCDLWTAPEGGEH